MKTAFSLIFFTVITLQTFSQNVGQEGDTVINYTDINGYKQGYWKKTYQNNNPKFEAYFIDDKPVGEMKRWDSYGNLFAVLNYDKKGETAQAVMYHKNGIVAATGKYYGQIKDSIWLYYSDNKKCYLQESYKKGKKHGAFKNFTAEGFLLEESHWTDSIKDGPWKKYYSNGALMWESTYVNGKLEGDAKSYFEDGKVYKEGKFINDLMEGAWFKYNENGGLEKVYQYKKGVSPEAEQESDAILREIIENKDKIEGPQDNNDIDWLRGGR
ncbi:MAG: hypothetical protein WCX31_10410 [Salinivirgaceae bacterium]